MSHFLFFFGIRTRMSLEHRAGLGVEAGGRNYYLIGRMGLRRRQDAALVSRHHISGAFVWKVQKASGRNGNKSLGLYTLDCE